MSSEQSSITTPVKGEARIALSAWRYITMPNDTFCGDGRIVFHQEASKSGQLLILLFGITTAIRPFQFDTDGKIIASLATGKLGNPRMPCPLLKGDKLHQLTIAPDQAVSRNLQPGNASKVGMSRSIKMPKEEIVNPVTTKLARWQTDAVDHQQGNFGLWPGVMMWRWQMRARN